MINANQAFGVFCCLCQLLFMCRLVSSIGQTYAVRIIIVGFGSKDLSLSPAQMENIYFKVYTRKRINNSIFHRIQNTHSSAVPQSKHNL